MQKYTNRKYKKIKSQDVQTADVFSEPQHSKELKKFPEENGETKIRIIPYIYVNNFLKSDFNSQTEKDKINETFRQQNSELLSTRQFQNLSKYSILKKNKYRPSITDDMSGNFSKSKKNFITEQNVGEKTSNFNLLSTKKTAFDIKFLTEASDDKNFISKKPQTRGSARMKQRSNRRNCKVTTQSQFAQFSKHYIPQKQQQVVNQMFRQVKREMKKSQKPKNNFYSGIRKQTITKINNHDITVKSAEQKLLKMKDIVKNCDIEIHRRNKIENYDSKRRNQKLREKENILKNQKQTLAKKQIDSFETNHNISSKKNISIKDFEKVQMNLGCEQNLKSINKMKKFKRIKSAVKIPSTIFKEKQQLNTQVSKIMEVCSKEKLKMDDLKENMKAFQFFCGRIDKGLHNRRQKIITTLVKQES